MEFVNSTISKFAGLKTLDHLKAINSPGDIQLLNVLIEYTASATVGNRTLALEVSASDGTVVLMVPIDVGLVVAASEVKKVQMSIDAVSYTDWSAGDFAVSRLPDEVLIPPVYFLRVIDLAAISTLDVYDLKISFGSTQNNGFDLMLADLWWEAGGASGILQALQPKNADDYAASLLDLSGNGNDAAEGTAPTWDAVNGWEFNGVDDYLDTAIVPTILSTLIVQFSTLTSNTGEVVLGEYDTLAEQSIYLLRDTSVLKVGYGDAIDDKADFTAGNYAIAGGALYRNGVSDGISTGVWGATGPAVAIYVGAANNAGGGAADFSAVYIQALAQYSGLLSASEIAAVAAAMAAL